MLFKRSSLFASVFLHQQACPPTYTWHSAALLVRDARNERILNTTRDGLFSFHVFCWDARDRLVYFRINLLREVGNRALALSLSLSMTETLVDGRSFANFETLYKTTAGARSPTRRILVDEIEWVASTIRRC